jgi:hypothetical protein
MTNLQEDLTLALHRRAEAVTVENHLDAILDDANLIRFSNNPGADLRRSGGLLVAASVAVLVGAGGLIWATNARTQPPAATSSAPAPVDTKPEADSVSTPSVTPGTIPAEFPSDVPRPDTFEQMTFMTADNEPVGWEFYDRREPTDSVERCTQYASSFEEGWTSTPKTDEHESVLYAQILDNGQWQVGIYCINDGGYLVQVMPTGAIVPLTADTLPPDLTQTQADAPLDAAVVAILHPQDQQTSADALAEALRARGVSVELVAETTRSFEQTMLMLVSGESNPASFALDDLIGIGGFDTWTPNLATAPLPANVTDVIVLGQDGRPTLPLTPNDS